MKRLVIVVFMFLSMASMYAQDSGDFTIGCFSYMKLWDSFYTFHDSIMGYMERAQYNATHFDTNNPDMDYGNGLISRLEGRGIKSYLADYYWDTNADTGEVTTGSHALSASNHWQFEAEYDSELFPNSDRYFHKFSHPDRTGSHEPDGSRDVWRCEASGDNPDPAGLALHGLQYRWRSYTPGYDSNTSTEEESIGFMFRFPYWFSDPITQTYISDNKLYLKYLISVGNNTSSLPQSPIDVLVGACTRVFLSPSRTQRSITLLVGSLTRAATYLPTGF